MENSPNQFQSKWTLTTSFEQALTNKTLSPKTLSLSLAANGKLPNNNNNNNINNNNININTNNNNNPNNSSPSKENNFAKVSKLAATQATAIVSSIAPDSRMQLRIQSFKPNNGHQMPVSLNDGIVILHPDIFGGVSQEQIEGLQTVAFTNVLSFLHSVVFSKAMERLRNGKGMGVGFMAMNSVFQSVQPKPQPPPNNNNLQTLLTLLQAQQALQRQQQQKQQQQHQHQHQHQHQQSQQQKQQVQQSQQHQQQSQSQVQQQNNNNNNNNNKFKR